MTSLPYYINNIYSNKLIRNNIIVLVTALMIYQLILSYLHYKTSYVISFLYTGIASFLLGKNAVEEIKNDFLINYYKPTINIICYFLMSYITLVFITDILSISARISVVLVIITMFIGELLLKKRKSLLAIKDNTQNSESIFSLFPVVETISKQSKTYKNVFLGIVVILFFTRIILSIYFHDLRMIGDEGGYLKRAYSFTNILKAIFTNKSLDAEDITTFYWNGWHPPFWPMIISGFIWLFDEAYVRVLQGVIGFLSGLYFYRFSLFFFESKKSLLLLALFVLNPYLIFFSHLLWSEILYILLLILYLIWFAIVFIEKNINTKKVTLIQGAVLVSSLILTRSSFVPVIVGSFICLLMYKQEVLKNLKTYFAVIILAFLLVLPWSYIIYKEDNILSVGTSVAGVQLAIKYNNKGFSDWHEAWQYFTEQKNKYGVPYNETSKEITKSYLDSLDGNYLSILSVAVGELISGYLFSDSFLERHLSWAIYPVSMPNLNIGILMYDYISRYLLIFLGAIGLAIGVLQSKYRILLFWVLLANAAIFVVGQSTGRYIVMNYPLLIIGVLALYSGIEKDFYQKLGFYFLSICLAIIAMGTTWQYKKQSVWPAAYVDAIKNYGGKVTEVADSVSIRKSNKCNKETINIKIVNTSHDMISIKQSGGNNYTDGKWGEDSNVILQNSLNVMITQTPFKYTKTLDLVVNNEEKHKIDLDEQIRYRWKKLDSCIDISWYGRRKL